MVTKLTDAAATDDGVKYGAGDIDAKERKRCWDLLDKQGLENVRVLSGQDAYPHTWRLAVNDWLTRGGKRPPEPKKEDVRDENEELENSMKGFVQDET